MIERARQVRSVGTSLRDLKAFPERVRQEAGYQIDRLQQGLEPVDWKIMKSVGAGVCEIRIRDVSGAFRVIYVAKLPAAIYVLHCFRKTTQATSRTDIELAVKRYREMMGST